MSRVPYNKLLTNLACSSRIGEYWPSVVFVRTSRCSVRTVTTSGQYSPVRPSRSVSKRLVILITHDSEKNNPTPAKDITLTRSDSSNIIVLPRRRHISTVVWHLEVYDMFSRQTCNQPGMTLVPGRIFQARVCALGR